jgi:hypothetical protein
MESKKLVINQEAMDLLTQSGIKLIDLKLAKQIQSESKDVKVEYPHDEPFNVTGVTLEQAREAAKKLND